MHKVADLFDALELNTCGFIQQYHLLAVLESYAKGQEAAGNEAKTYEQEMESVLSRLREAGSARNIITDLPLRQLISFSPFLAYFQERFHLEPHVIKTMFERID
jgi:hypothetical protein